MAVVNLTQIQSRLFHLKGDVCESEGGEGQTEGGRGEGRPAWIPVLSRLPLLAEDSSAALLLRWRCDLGSNCFRSF